MTQHVIEIAGLYKDYDTPAGVFPVLKDVNLTIEEGDFVAIMGPSGSGKSTFMNILGCLDRPTKGEYKLDCWFKYKIYEHDKQAILSNRLTAVLPRLCVCV